MKCSENGWVFAYLLCHIVIQFSVLRGEHREELNREVVFGADLEWPDPDLK